MNPRHLRHTRCQKLFLFPQAVAQQKKKAELFYKERLWVYNYVMQKTKIIQKDYSLSSMNYQLKLPFELEVLIPDIIIRPVFCLRQKAWISALFQQYKCRICSQSK